MTRSTNLRYLRTRESAALLRAALPSAVALALLVFLAWVALGGPARLDHQDRLLDEPSPWEAP